MTSPALDIILRGGIFTPKKIPGLVSWYEAGPISGLTVGAAVSSWPDLSGNARHAIQGTGAAQPLAAADGITFDGVDDVLTIANAILFGPAMTIFLLATPTSGTSDYYFAFDGTTGILGHYSASTVEWYRNGTDRATYASPVSGLHLFSMTHVDGASAVGHYDGAPVISFVPTVAMAGSAVTFIGGSAFAGDYVACDITAMIAYNRALSGPERQKVERYLSRRHPLLVLS